MAVITTSGVNCSYKRGYAKSGVYFSEMGGIGIDVWPGQISALKLQL